MKAPFAALALLVPHAGNAAPEVTTARYTCDRGIEVPATYFNTPDGSVVVVNVDGTQVTLLGEPAASGARYGWPSDGSNYVWWTKADTATLYWKTPEGEATLLTCALKA